MKHTYKNSSLLLVLLLVFMSFAVVSCSDDDSTGGQPQITGVKILTNDTINYSYDSLYNKAGAGTMIAIMGTSLQNATKVLINNQDIYINPTMNTDHSIIVTIPSERDGFKLSAFDSSIPDIIEVQTDHGTATYAFKVTAPGPQLQRIDASYPRNAGDTLRLNGLNLVDIQKIYITDYSAAALDTTIWTEVPGNRTEINDYFNIKQDHHLNNSTRAYETSSIVGAVVPENAPDSGAIVVEAAAGTTYLAYYKRPGVPVITSVSSDMPEIGETLIITGREFVQVSEIKYGDVTLGPSDYTVADTQDSIFIPFTKKPTQGSGMTITVTTPGGTVTQGNFFDYSTLLTTFDNDDASDEGWGPNASYVDGGNADGKYANINVAREAQQWWGTMIFFKKDWSGNNFTLSDNIPSNASADDIYFAFNVYDNGDYNNGSFWGYLRYTLWPNSGAGQESNTAPYQYDNFAWDDYDAGIGSFPDGPVLQDINGVNHKRRWYRAVVPIKKFPSYSQFNTYGEVKNAGVSIFRIQSINQSSNTGKIDARIDNVRIIYIPKK